MGKGFLDDLMELVMMSMAIQASKSNSIKSNSYKATGIMFCTKGACQILI